MEFRPSRFEILPPAIKNLLIINVLCFLAQQAFGGFNSPIPVNDLFALHAWQSPLFKPWQLVTYMFMHGDWGHIFFNMLALWMFGAVLENVWGSKRFLIFYFVSGLGAALLHLLVLSYELLPLVNDYSAILNAQARGSGVADAVIRFTQNHNIFQHPSDVINYLSVNPAGVTDKMMEGITSYYMNSVNGTTVGASGAVFGILAAFGYLFPNTYIYLYMLIPVKAKWFVLFYAAIELYSGIRNSAGDNLAHWAHLGGAIVGLAIVITWNKTNRKTLY